MNHYFSCLIVALACSEKPSVADASPTISAPVASRPKPADELARLDSRKPIPLLPMMANHQRQNMRDHLVAVQEILGALSKDDFKAVSTSAGRLGYSETMGNMCKHMGSGAPGFADAALAFHHAADTIAVAAAQRSHKKVLVSLSETLGHCTSCHAAWKQEVVDAETWNNLSR
jgi:hypothetical protein